VTREPPIELVVIGGGVPGELLDAVRDGLQTVFGRSVRLGPSLALPVVGETGSLESAAILDFLIDRSGADPSREWVLALTAHPLHAPDRPFVFGEATVGGAWAVVSTAHLVSESPRSAASPDLSAASHSTTSLQSSPRRWGSILPWKSRAGQISVDLVAERLLKEAVHELGHVAGLNHCDARVCVMRMSEDTVDVDSKSLDFCPACAVKLSGLRDPESV
jgi:predicted Zn-dependent protease